MVVRGLIPVFLKPKKKREKKEKDVGERLI
jgi:hypothetical protein